MKFWDSSAVLPILISEPSSAGVVEIFRRDTGMIVWWGTELECVSALSRREREVPHAAEIQAGFLRLDHIRERWNEVSPISVVRETGRRLLRTHPLRAPDALQLAAAIVAAEGRPKTLSFVCLNDRLITAARKEGFTVLPDREH